MNKKPGKFQIYDKEFIMNSKSIEDKESYLAKDLDNYPFKEL